MDITSQFTKESSEKVKIQLDLKASASEEETLSDHYVILRSLGKGNFAEVKLAYHLHTEVQVAVKVLQNGAKNDFSIKTKIDMYKTLDHPYVIKLFHIINTKEYTYTVLEHAAGGDLVSYMGSVGRLQEEQAQHIFTQLVCAAHYCHDNGIAHRDIKLDNILLDAKGNIKLCDFGLATLVTARQVGVDMDITSQFTKKSSEKVKIQLDLKASASEEETLSDHYVILRSHGKGNFAEVKIAYHLHTEEQVAVKVLQNGAKNDFSRKTEIDMYETLDHPYVIKLFHIISTKEYTYMVLEHTAGGDLVSYIGRVGRLQEEQAQHIITQLVCAVHYFHDNGIAHRDITLDNILLDAKGNIKLWDFGLAP
ncbi:hypothetical protein NN561_017258 [Cricetulus griseus]